MNLINRNTCYFRYALLFFVFLTPILLKAQEINWISWEEAEAASKIEKRKVIVDIYTDWCKVCRHMHSSTLSDPEIINYINKHFYAIKFNAEKKEYITYKGKEYSYGDRGFRGYHQLAVILTQGDLRFPTMVFLNEELDVIQPIPGYQNKSMFSLIISYFAENYYIRTPWKTYTSRYKNSALLLGQ